MKPFIFYFIFTLLFFLTGCSVGPHYIPPIATVPSSWGQGRENILPVTNEEAWWRNFNDPVLNELIEQDSVRSLNLKTAQAKVMLARANYTIATAQFYPSASLKGLPPTGTGIQLNQLIGLIATIEPDLWGKLRQNKQRSLAGIEAAEAENDFTLTTLYADIASSYLEFRAAQRKDKILRYNLVANKQFNGLLRSRYKAGFINYLNIAQQDGLIETIWAELEQNKAVITALLYKIELLTGNNPGLLATKLLPIKPVPQLNQTINLGVPSEILRRRPDIIAAERQVAAAHANIRIAMASLYPEISAGWFMGWQGRTLLSNISSIQNPESSFFETFIAPLFNLSLYRNVDLKKNEKILAVINYERVVMFALHEVVTQYNYCQHYKLSSIHLKRALDQKRLVVKLAKNAYEKGSSNFETLLRAEEDLNRLEISHLNMMVMNQIAKINLYKALGGGIYDKKTKKSDK